MLKRAPLLLFLVFAAWPSAGGQRVPFPGMPDWSTVPEGPMGAAIEAGYRLATETPERLPAYAKSRLHCTSCHLAGGSRANAGPWVGVAAVFPEFRTRNAKVNRLEDRINDCFERSLNGKRLPLESRELAQLVAYMAWLSRGVPMGTEVTGRGFGRIEPAKVPDRARGLLVYRSKCTPCHGADGQGQTSDAGAYLYPPLWGDASFNIGAGMARLDTAAAFILHNMPLGAGGTLSPQEAYDVADYVIHQPRPDFAAKALDWPDGGKPKDARY